ncbi:MAG: sigma-70 family RNA polymerase sigma factor [Planctomycetes bacterium]|nr:sigma-70 family RNA polymerase sigma factor [Planctomycetota bacterium]
MHLFTAHQRRLYGFIRSLVANPADAEDLVQQTVTILWRKFDTFEPGSDFAAWALATARLEVMNFRRRASAKQTLFDDQLFEQLADEAAAVHEQYDARREALAVCLTKLPEESRRLIGMFYEKEMPIDRIAREIERSDKTVYRLIAKAHHLLLACIRKTVAEL